MVVFNQRSIEEIFETILMVARMVAAEAAGVRLADRLRGELAEIAEAAGKFPRRPRVFFEEWPDPWISGIRWVDELVEAAGGEAIFPRLREEQSATGRIVTAAQIAAANPDVVIALVRKEGQQGADSLGENWSQVEAARCTAYTTVDASCNPPAALTEVRQLHATLAR
jgi:iron complex transport system substrate-binding protein